MGTLVIFSKIIWYDLRVYIEAADRRDVLTLLFAGWLLAQLAVALVLLRPLWGALRQVWPVVAVWVAAITPYLMLGGLQGDINVFYLGDLARYALPVWFLVFFVWALGRFDAGDIVAVLALTLGTTMLARTALHLWLSADSDQIARFGVTWEMLAGSLLVAMLFRIRKRSTGAAIVLAAGLVTTVIVYGQTRAIMGGFGLATGVAMLLIFSQPDTSRRQRLSAFLATALAGIIIVTPFFLQIEQLRRVSGEIIGDFDIEAPVPPADEPDGWHFLGGEEANAPLLERIEYDWINSIVAGTGSLDTRTAEALYFMTLSTITPKAFLLGTGAGHSVSIDLGSFDRQVRGAHVTPVTLVYRHGAPIGVGLYLLLCLYGLRHHYRALRHGEDADARVLLAALLGYRVAIVPATLLHQGLFDDPVVVLSIALAWASSPQATTMRRTKSEGAAGQAMARSAMSSLGR